MLSSLAAADRATDSSFAGTPIARIQVCGRQAKAHARLIEGGTVTTALVGQIAVAKYGPAFRLLPADANPLQLRHPTRIDIPQMKSGTA